MAFKDGLAQAMAAQDLTHEALAMRLDVSRVAVTQWLSGEVMPKGSRYDAIAKALDTTVPALFAPVNQGRDIADQAADQEFFRVWGKLSDDLKISALTLLRAALAGQEAA